MAVIGSATLNIVPKVEGGLSNYINGEIAKANLSAAGSDAGEKFTSGMTSGASFGIWSQVASRAIDTVVGSLGSAASRVDTLNNYPRIMQTLGVETEDANRSIQTMSAELSNVPTRLDDMANTVQGIYAASSKYGTSLDTVTDAGLALNSMLLAGGQSTSIVTSAMEQFRQMVAKGKPDMQDWRSLLSAAPGQMNQLAQEMLGATATADDLYAALGGGKEGDYEGPFEWGSIGMDEFITKLAGMKETFAGAAEDAQGGISTSLANMQNAVTRGVAGVLEAFGQENIAGAIGDVKGMINDAFGGIQDVAQQAAPGLMRLWDNLSPAIPTIAGVAGALGGLKLGIDAVTTVGSGVTSLFTTVSTKALDFATSTGAAEKATALLGESFNPLALGAGVAVAGVGALAYAAYDAWKKEQDFKSGLEGVSSSADLLRSAMAGGSGATDEMGTSFQHAHADIDGLSDAMAEYNQKSEAIRQSTQESVGTLSSYRTAIDEAAQKIAEGGKLSADEVAKLQLALDGLNEAAGTSYTVDQFTQEREHVQELRAEIDQLVADKINEARQSALSEMYKESYSLQAKAATEATRAQMDLNDAQAEYNRVYEEWKGMGVDDATAQSQAMVASGIVEAQKALNDANAAYGEATQTVESYASMMGNAATSTDGANAALVDWVNTHALAGASVAETSTSLDLLAKAMGDAGISTEQLDAIGEETFSQLAMSCNGSVDSMVASLALYNQQGIEDKDGKISVDQIPLVDAMGNVYTWNGEKLVDKNGKAVVNDTQLMDAYGNVISWNGKELRSKNARVTTDQGGLPSLLSTVQRFINLPSNTTRTFTTRNVTVNEVRNTSGVGAHNLTTSTGGHVTPRHAAGYIAAGPTLTNWGVVGEDGIEAVYNNSDGSSDVYPLNNPRYLGYADPLGERIARSVAKAFAGRVGGNSIEIHVDGSSDPEAVAWEVADRLQTLLNAG